MNGSPATPEAQARYRAWYSRHVTSLIPARDAIRARGLEASIEDLGASLTIVVQVGGSEDRGSAVSLWVGGPDQIMELSGDRVWHVDVVAGGRDDCDPVGAHELPSFVSPETVAGYVEDLVAAIVREPADEVDAETRDAEVRGSLPA